MPERAISVTVSVDLPDGTTITRRMKADPATRFEIELDEETDDFETVHTLGPMTERDFVHVLLHRATSLTYQGINDHYRSDTRA